MRSWTGGCSRRLRWLFPALGAASPSGGVFLPGVKGEPLGVLPDSALGMNFLPVTLVLFLLLLLLLVLHVPAGTLPSQLCL